MDSQVCNQGPGVPRSRITALFLRPIQWTTLQAGDTAEWIVFDRTFLMSINYLG